MSKRWFHVTSHNACWGFAIDEDFIVTDVAPIAYKNLYGRSVKDNAVRSWIREQKLNIIEVYPLTIIYESTKEPANIESRP